MTAPDPSRVLVTSDDPRLSDARTPSAHTHPVSDVGGLQAALDGKAATSHTHSTAQVTGLDSALAGKASTSHTHPVSDVGGLQAALDGKAATGHTHTKAQVGLGNVDNTSDAAKPVSTATQAALNTKVTNAGGASGLWVGTTASLPTTGTAGVLYVTTD